MKQQFTVERAENRTRMKITAMLVGRHDALGVEKAFTENVSSRGVGVISANQWMEDDVILVSIPAGSYSSAARVTHCVPIGTGQYRTGFEFIGSSKPLQINSLSGSAEPSAN
jgi:PilZ domain-containing protein